MSKDPALLIYSADILSEIADLTLEERGQYLTMMLLQHRKGPLTEKLLKLQLGQAPSKDVLSKCAIDEGGNCYMEWVERERDRRKAHSNKQRENVLKRWNKQTKEIPEEYNGNTTVIPLVTVTDTVTKTNTKAKTKTSEAELWPGFDDFWNLYDKKVSKKTTSLKWQKLPYKTKLKIMEHLPEYVASTPNKKYRKDPQTYLNKESWENEIIYNNENNESGKSDIYRKLKQQTNIEVSSSEVYTKY